jgi:hypothetical protein
MPSPLKPTASGWATPGIAATSYNSSMPCSKRSHSTALRESISTIGRPQRGTASLAASLSSGSSPSKVWLRRGRATPITA